MKTKRASRADIEARNIELTKDASVLGIALNYLANGDFRNIGTKSFYTVKVAGENACHGGIVLVKFHPHGQRPYSAAYYFEEWFGQQQGFPPSDNPEVIALRELAYEAKRWVSSQQTLAA